MLQGVQEGGLAHHLKRRECERKGGYFIVWRIGVLLSALKLIHFRCHKTKTKKTLSAELQLGLTQGLSGSMSTGSIDLAEGRGGLVWGLRGVCEVFVRCL